MKIEHIQIPEVISFLHLTDNKWFGKAADHTNETVGITTNYTTDRLINITLPMLANLPFLANVLTTEGEVHQLHIEAIIDILKEE